MSILPIGDGCDDHALDYMLNDYFWSKDDVYDQLIRAALDGINEDCTKSSEFDEVTYNETLHYLTLNHNELRLWSRYQILSISMKSTISMC